MSITAGLVAIMPGNITWVVGVDDCATGSSRTVSLDASGSSRSRQLQRPSRQRPRARHVVAGPADESADLDPAESGLRAVAVRDFVLQCCSRLHDARFDVHGRDLLERIEFAIERSQGRRRGRDAESLSGLLYRQALPRSQVHIRGADEGSARDLRSEHLSGNMRRVPFSDLTSVAEHWRRLARPSDTSVSTRRFRIPGHELASEEVPIDVLPAGLVRLLATPTMIDEVAAGDVVRCSDDTIVEVVERGGNVGLLFEFRQPLGELPQRLAESLDDLNGWVDGWQTSNETSVIAGTVPVSIGFTAIERVASAFAAAHSGVWFFKNVYDDDGRALDWW